MKKIHKIIAYCIHQISDQVRVEYGQVRDQVRIQVGAQVYRPIELQARSTQLK